MSVFDDARIHFPRYLSPAQSESLFAELSRFPDLTSYFGVIPEKDPLQGDAWSSFVVRRTRDGVQKNVTGIVLSNTCDLSTENRRALSVRAVFAPLVRLDRYLDLLEKAGQTPQQIKGIAAGIQDQRVTSIFYLPPNSALGGPTIALLDDVHSMPYTEFLEREPERVFSLSQAGFYIFLLKLSIHFTRLMEGIARPGPRPWPAKPSS